MTPVLILSDGYIANGSEPWRVLDFDELEKIPVKHLMEPNNGDEFLPYLRNEKLARPWAIPGTPGLMHRIGGLEKEDGTGNVCYDPDNHQHMVEIRAKKVQLVAEDIPLQDVSGPEEGELLVLSWGGTYGSCYTAARNCRQQGKSVAHAHLRWLNPLPRNIGELLSKYKKVLIPELNMGQLRTLIRAEFLIDAIGFNKVKGKPFTVAELMTQINELC